MHIGLTGNIGSGKTMVCRVFEKLGVPVYHADLEARRLLNTRIVQQALKELFGDGLVDRSGHTDRKMLASMVFGNPARLQALNALIHPLVEKDYLRWRGDRQGVAYTLQEAAILFETGWDRHMDQTILVTAPREERIRRVCRRDGVSREEVLRRMQHQWDEKKLEDRAGFTIHNDGRLLVIPQILRIHESLVRPGR